jgi:hypothetical protein
MAVSRIARFFSVVLVLSALGPAVFAADDDALAVWRRAKSQIESYQKSLHPLGTLHIQDLFHLRRDGGALELMSRAPDMTDNTPMVATFDDIAGSAEVFVHHKPGTTTIDRFQLNLMDFPAERRVFELHVNLDAERGQLMISQSNQNDGMIEQTMLEQLRPARSGPSNFIRLSVATSSVNNVQSDQLTFVSPDFNAFVQNRPDETMRYLRPLLRQLGQEMVFAPDQRVAEQVLGSLRRVDPVAQKQVMALLSELDDPNYRVRNAASTKLKTLGRAAADVLDRMDRTKLSPEQNVRIDLFLMQYDPASAKELAHLRLNPTFLLDCLYSDQSDIRWAALEQLRNVLNPSLEFDPEAPEEARSLSIAALRRRLTPGQ